MTHQRYSYYVSGRRSELVSSVQYQRCRLQNITNSVTRTLKPDFVIQYRLWTFETFKNEPWQMFFKIGSLRHFATFTWKRMCWVLFLIKLQVWRSATFSKRDPTSGFSCGYCQIFKSSFFNEIIFCTRFSTTLSTIFSTTFENIKN